jgi:riboflavin synthase alpha subunit
MRSASRFTLGTYKPGAVVNLEADLRARYLDRPLPERFGSKGVRR